MYQQTLGRFLSRDPLSENGVDVLSDTGFYSNRLTAMNKDPWQYGGNWENPYMYAMNNPARHTDPSGLEVTVRCSPVERYTITLGYHCAVVVECNGITCRYDGGGEQSVGANPAYPDRPKAKEDCTADAATKSEDDIDYRIGSIWKSCENEMA